MSRRASQAEADKVPDSGGSSKTNFIILGTIADTTWRMFTPVIALLLLGWWLDNKFDAKPWFILSGVFIGFGLAIGLVWLQYRQVDGGNKR